MSMTTSSIMITVIIMMHVHDDDVDDPGHVDGFHLDNVAVHDGGDDDDGDDDDDDDDDDYDDG